MSDGMEIREWNSINTAPRDGTWIIGRYGDGSEDLVQWRDNRQCMLGPAAGECGPGFVSKDAGNLPVDGLVEWRLQ